MWFIGGQSLLSQNEWEGTSQKNYKWLTLE